VSLHSAECAQSPFRPRCSACGPTATHLCAVSFTFAVYRTRDLYSAADGLANKFLTREVEYASGAAVNYSKSLKEAQDVKVALRKLQGGVDGLARSVAGARVVAARLIATAETAPSPAPAAAEAAS
jgi:hypothetical protein